MSLLDTASLIVTPNGYKEGKLYSVIPSDGSGDLSVTRATTATRVNSAGLVELVPYNLVEYSEQFDNAAWTKANATVSANATTAPDGTLTADKLIPSSGSIGTIQQIHNITALQICTMSIFVKADGINTINLNSRTPDGLNDVTINFNLTSGTIISVTSFGSYSSASGTITDYENGWYRLTLTHFTSITTSTRVRFFSSETGDGTKGLFLWGGQFVEGSTALPYQKTETRLNIPRLDYSNGTCPSILVEPQRTNLALWSSSFDNAAWTKTAASVTANATTAPDGTNTADKLIEGTATSQHLLLQAYYFNSITYTISVYLKANTRTKAMLAFGGNTLGLPSFDYRRAEFDLSLGTVLFTPINGTATISEVVDGWYRCTITITPLVSALAYINIFTLNDLGQSTYTGDGTSGLYVWGAQLEAGSYPTSYIPTTSASVTRNADVISKTGISSLIGQTEGTLFVDFVPQSKDFQIFYQVRTTGSTNVGQVDIRYQSSNLRALGNDNALTQFNISAGDIVIGQRYKCAVRYQLNNVAFYVNGSLAGTDLSATFASSSKEQVAFCDNLGNFIPQAEINAAVLWDTALTNDQLAALTTI